MRRRTRIWNWKNCTRALPNSSYSSNNSKWEPRPLLKKSSQAGWRPLICKLLRPRWALIKETIAQTRRRQLNKWLWMIKTDTKSNYSKRSTLLNHRSSISSMKLKTNRTRHQQLQQLSHSNKCHNMIRLQHLIIMLMVARIIQISLRRSCIRDGSMLKIVYTWETQQLRKLRSKAIFKLSKDLHSKKVPAQTAKCKTQLCSNLSC